MLLFFVFFANFIITITAFSLNIVLSCKIHIYETTCEFTRIKSMMIDGDNLLDVIFDVFVILLPECQLYGKAC